jgi:hypothetical protein
VGYSTVINENTNVNLNEEPEMCWLFFIFSLPVVKKFDDISLHYFVVTSALLLA